MKYFYIIQFDHGIIELPYSLEAHKATMEAHVKGGVAFMNDCNGEPLSVNAGGINKVLTEQQYQGHIQTSGKPYVKDGSWYDKKHVLVRNEDWKQKRIDDKELKRLEERDVEITDEQKAKNIQRLKDIHKEVFGNK